MLKYKQAKRVLEGKKIQADFMHELKNLIVKHKIIATLLINV